LKKCDDLKVCSEWNGESANLATVDHLNEAGAKMKKIILCVLILISPVLTTAQSEQKTDIWQPLRFLEGSWQGEGEGMSGHSTATQDYEFILNGQFLRMRSKSVFEPQEKNPKGEIHEDLAICSYDKSRETFVLRAFYVEGFVNMYVLSEISEEGAVLTFETEAVENAPPGTKAKLIFKQISENEMEESFFVAFPGKELGCISTNRLKKK